MKPKLSLHWIMAALIGLGSSTTITAAFAFVSTSKHLSRTAATTNTAAGRMISPQERTKTTVLSMEQVYPAATTTKKKKSLSTTSSSSSDKSKKIMEKAVMSQEMKPRRPSWIDLPLASVRQSSSNSKRTYSRSLASAELLVGRIAMIGAISLILGEIMTGQTFWQQLLQAAATTMNT